MFEKLKSLGEAAKNVVLYILGPAVAVVAYFFYLKGKNTELEAKVNQTAAERDLAGTLVKKEDAKNEADKAEIDYNRIKRLYLESAHNDDGGSEPPPAA